MASTRPENGAEQNGAAADTDRVLLTRFVRRGDEAAFTEIVRRHSDLVFGVCQRTLRDRQAAEDAFQATFLVLARAARKIRRRTSLGSWLHGVACRVSLRALAKRHRRRETCSPMNTPATEPALQDVGEIYEQQLLDAELQTLPEKYREPLVLHYLQGLSNQQVADRLDVSVSCVEGRLKRGKKELRLRLTRRGIELGVALAAVQLTSAAARAGALESLITSTAHVAHVAASQTLTSVAAPSEAASQLAAKEIAMLATTKTSILLTSVVTAVLAAGLIAGLSPSARTARADTPHGQFTATLESSIGDSPSTFEALAQADTTSQQPASEAGEKSTERLLRTIEVLRDELKQLEAEYEFRVTQSEQGRAASQGEIDALRTTIEKQQAEIVNLTEELAAATAAANGRETPAAENQSSWDFKALDPQTRQIMAALDDATDIQFPANPLRDVVDYISQSNNIPILLDENNLQEAGIGPDQEVSLVISGITLRNALEIMLNDVAGVPLDYVVENQVLKITTREQADSLMETRVYSLKHLPADYAPEDLARVIIRTVAPETWRNSVVGSDDGGGYESMGMGGAAMGAYGGGEGMMYAGGGSMSEGIEPGGGPGKGSIETLPGVLVVTQSQRVHRQIVDLLSQLKLQYEEMQDAVGYGEMMGTFDSGGEMMPAGGSGAYPGGAFGAEDAGAAPAGSESGFDAGGSPVPGVGGGQEGF